MVLINYAGFLDNNKKQENKKFNMHPVTFETKNNIKEGKGRERHNRGIKQRGRLVVNISSDRFYCLLRLFLTG